MARRNQSFQQLFLETLSQVGPAAMQAGKLVGDSRRAEAEDTRQEAESKARLGLTAEQTRNAKTTADKGVLDYNQALQEDTLKKSLVTAAGERDAAQEGTKTPDGRAVDFQAVKKANRGFEQADAKLWNFLNPKAPMSAEGLKATRTREEGDAVLASEEKQAEATRKQEKHESDLKTAEATRLTGRYQPVALDGGRIGAMNTKTGAVSDTGEKGAPKGGAGQTVDGDTAIPGLSPIKGVAITKDSVKAVKDAYAKYSDFKNQLGEYRALIDKYGAEALGEHADEMQAYHTGLAMTLKELQNLGVLNGPDLALLQKEIPQAAGLGAKAKSVAYGAVGQDSLGPRLNALETNVESKFKTMARANGFQMAAPGGAESGTEPSPAATDSGLAATVWRRGKDGREYEFDAKTRQPTGNSR